MLVLQRSKDHQILIGDDVRITINRVQGGKVVVGVDAPKETHILRAELDPKLAAQFDQAYGKVGA